MTGCQLAPPRVAGQAVRRRRGYDRRLIVACAFDTRTARARSPWWVSDHSADGRRPASSQTAVRSASLAAHVAMPTYPRGAMVAVVPKAAARHRPEFAPIASLFGAALGGGVGAFWSTKTNIATVHVIAAVHPARMSDG